MLASRWRRLPVLVAATCSLSCWGGSWGVWPSAILANFGVIEEGVAYRSAQPDPEDLAAAVEVYGLRTVINLRGANPGDAWYDAEAGVCAELGITLVDHPMSARSLPAPDLLAAVIQTLETAEPPVLIHCQAGADRTGAVAAIYRMLIMGHDKADALSELTPQHLHFRAFTPCMDALAEMYEPAPAWLDEYAARFDELDCK
jgi:protein tyrosine phosphatase (PTP) superfamily phosphohydrolase (DUF442 family)